MFSGTVIWWGGFVLPMAIDYVKSWGLWVLNHRYIFVWIIIGYFVFMWLYDLIWSLILKKL